MIGREEYVHIILVVQNTTPTTQVRQKALLDSLVFLSSLCNIYINRAWTLQRTIDLSKESTPTNSYDLNGQKKQTCHMTTDRIAKLDAIEWNPPRCIAR